jgi:hypothetical protein
MILAMKSLGKISSYKILLVGLILTFLLLTTTIQIKSQNVPNENKPQLSSENGENPYSLTVIKDYSEIIAVVLEAIVIILLWKTVKDFSELAKVSKLQTEVRFRPWVGPSGGFELLREDDAKKQYSIAMKNFGEVPASNVIVTCTISDTKPDKSNPMNNSKSNGNNQFQIGPLLPGMEKRYWIFIENERFRKTMEGASNIFIFIYFSYVYSGGKSGYGMISQLDNKTNNFVHKEMWID